MNKDYTGTIPDDNCVYTGTQNYDMTGETDDGSWWISIGPSGTEPPYSSNSPWSYTKEIPIDWRMIKSLRREMSLINSFDIMREHQNQFIQSRAIARRHFALRGSRI